MKYTSRVLFAAALCLIAGSARAQVELKPKVLEGTTRSEHTLSLKQALKIAGMEIPTSVDLNGVTVITTDKPGADGSHRVSSKTDKFVIKIAAPGIDLNFDSAKPDATPVDNPMLKGAVQVWKALSGSTYTLVVNGKGEITSVEGADKIIEKAGQEGADELKNQLSLTRLKREAAQESGALPDKAVKKGDRWERTEVDDIGSGQTLTRQTFYEYAGTVERNGKTFDKVNIFVGDVKYAQDPNAAIGAKITKSDLKVASSLGSYLFDRETGMVIERTTNTRITGTLTLDVNGMEIPADLDLTMDESTTAKR
jgi:hypothetical protein